MAKKLVTIKTRLVKTSCVTDDSCSVQSAVHAETPNLRHQRKPKKYLDLRKDKEIPKTELELIAT